MKGGISTTPPSDDAENHNAAKLPKDSKDRFGGGSSRSVSSRGTALLCEDKKLRLACPAWTRSLVACNNSLTLAAPRSSLAALPPPPLEAHREKEVAPLDTRGSPAPSA